jgi:hypothetical protein
MIKTLLKGVLIVLFFSATSHAAYTIPATVGQYLFFGQYYSTADAGCKANYGLTTSHAVQVPQGSPNCYNGFPAGRNTYNCLRISDNACFTILDPQYSCPSGFTRSNQDGSWNPGSGEYCTQPDVTCTPPEVAQPNNTCAIPTPVCTPPKILQDNTCVLKFTASPKSTSDTHLCEGTRQSISFNAGNEVIRETDYAGLGYQALVFMRTYNSTIAAASDNQGLQ